MILFTPDIWKNLKFNRDNCLDSFVCLTGVILLFMGIMTLLSRVVILDIISGISLGYSSMSLSSSIFFMVFGLFLITGLWKCGQGIYRSFVLSITTLFSIYGFLQFVRYSLYIHPNFKNLLYPLNEFLNNYPFLGMSPYSGLLIFFSSIAFLLTILCRERILILNIVGGLGIIVSFAGFLVLLGYLFGTPTLYSGSIFRLAPTTAFAYLWLGGGLVSMAGAKTVFLRLFMKPSARAKVLRVFLPLIISILLLHGILNVILTHYYNVNPVLILALLTVFTIIFSILIIIHITRIIFQRADDAEAERIKAEETLTSSEKKYRYIFENNPQPMWVYDIETLAFLEVNRYAILHYGYSRNEFLNMRIKDIRLPEDINSLLEENGKTTNELFHAGDWQHKKKNGQIIFVEINSHLIDYDNKPARLVIATDITNRKLLENTLKESEAQFRELFDEAPVGYHELDLEGKVVRVNRTEFEMLGYSRDEMLGKYAWEFIVDQEASKQAVLAKIANKKPREKNFERIIRRKDGSTFPILIEDLLLFDKNGKCIGIRTAIQDITERKKADIERNRINKELIELNATKDKFFSIIGHDLRGPIGGFKSLIEMMILNFDLTDTARLTKALKIIQSSASSTFELLENLLSWARSQRNEIEFNPVNVKLNEIIELSLKPLNGFAQGKQINIIDNLPRNQMIYADSNMLMTIMRNLISNAIKFTNPGKNIYLTAFENKDKWTISVKDEGIGIEHENLYKIFNTSENFTTSGTLKEKGSGLGLLLCAEFVKKHGGKIWVVSDSGNNRNGKGSDFKFSLPKNQQEMEC